MEVKYYRVGDQYYRYKLLSGTSAELYWWDGTTWNWTDELVELLTVIQYGQKLTRLELVIKGWTT